MSDERSHRLLCVGGGTGGSVSPLLAVAAEWLRQFPASDRRFWGSAAGPERTLVTEAGLPFSSLPAGKLRRYASFANLLDLVKILCGFFVALTRLVRWRPSVIVSAGSYVAVPVVWAGWILRIPSLIHQQDVRPGLANRLMLPFASRLTLTFNESNSFFPSGKTVVTGNPFRPELAAGSARRGRELWNFHEELPILLCLGGGTGARSLNELLVSIAPTILEQAQVLHLTGPGKLVPFVHPRYRAVPFLTADFSQALAMADLVISRAGLSTLTELAVLAKPTIVVPLPDTHQEANAAFFARPGAVRVVEQRAGATALLAAVQSLLTNTDVRRQLSIQIQRLVRPDATQAVVAELVKLVKAGDRV